MSSNIIFKLNNPSRPYDSEYPRKGITQPSQQFRDNFKNIEEAFYEANLEMSDLMGRVDTIDTNLGDLQNNFANKTIVVNGDFTFTSNPFGNNSDPITLTLTMSNLLPAAKTINTAENDLSVSVNQKGLVTSIDAVPVVNNVDTSKTYGIDITSLGTGSGTMVLPNMTFDSKGRLKAITDVSVSYGLFNHNLPKYSLVVGSDAGSIQFTAPTPTPTANDYYLGLDSSSPSGFAWKQLDISGYGFLTTVSADTGLLSTAISPTETKVGLDITSLDALSYLTLYDNDEFLVYSNDVNGHRKIAWSDIKVAFQGGFITRVEDDSAPKLGGNLDLNGKIIFSSSSIGITSDDNISITSNDPTKGVFVGNNFLAGNNASVGDDMTIGDNLTVGSFANIGNNLTVGNNANFGDYVTIGRYASISDYLSVGNNMTIGTGLTVGNDASFADNISFGNNVTFGDNISFGGNISLNGILWPNADGTAGQFLTTDGNGNLYWSASIGGVASIEIPYTIFVSKNGNDISGDGKITSPVLTIGQAVSMVPSGDNNKWTIILIDGSYDEDIIINNIKNIGIESYTKSNKSVITGSVTLGYAIENFEMENIIFDRSSDTTLNPALATTIDIVNLSVTDCDFIRGETLADIEKPIIQFGGTISGTAEFNNCGFQGKITNTALTNKPIKFINNRNIGSGLPSFYLTAGSKTFINGFEKIGHVIHHGGETYIENVNSFGSLTETIIITYPTVYLFDHDNYVPILELDNGNPIRVTVNGEIEDEFGNPYSVEVLDENGNEVLEKDSFGNYIQDEDELGNPLFDEYGDPIYKVMRTIYIQATYTQPDDYVDIHYGIKSDGSTSELLSLKNVSLFNETDYSSIYKTGTCPWKFINVDRRADYDTINGPRSNFQTIVDTGEFTPVLIHNGTKLIYKDNNQNYPNNRLDSYSSKSFFVTLEGNASIDVLGHDVDFNPNGTTNADSTIQEISIIVQQDSTGNRTLSFNGLFEQSNAVDNTSIIWVGDNTPNMEPDSITAYNFKYISGSNIWIAGKSLGGSGSGNDKIVMKNITITAGNSIIINPSDSLVFNHTVDPHSIIVDVTVKDTNPSSPTFDMFLPATMVATVAKNDNEIIIFNESANDLVFNIILKK